MKNICFFNSLNFWGGGEKLHLENAIEFQQKGYNVCLFARKNAPLWQKAKKENIKTLAVKVRKLDFLNPFTLFSLVQKYKKEKIDTVVFSTSQDMKCGAMGAWLAGVKNIVYLRGLAVPIKASFVNQFLFKNVLTHIIANSEETKRSILKNLYKVIDADKVAVIYHGIEYEENQERILKAIKEHSKGIILGNAGRLTTQKGQDKLVEVARLLKEKSIAFTLFIAGTGVLESKLKAQIKAYDLEKEVVLLGFVEKMNVFYESIDVFLLSSEWEGFGYVIAEAMQKAKPVVAFDISSNPEIISQNETGFLVPFADVKQFTQKIIDLAQDKNLRQTMGRAGVQRVQQKFIRKDRIDELEMYLKKD